MRIWISGLGACALLASCDPSPANESAPKSAVSISTSSSASADASSVSALAQGPDCSGFSGAIHGTTTCIHVDFPSGALRPLHERPFRQRGVVTAPCDHDLVLPHERLHVVCTKTTPKDADAGVWNKAAVVSVDVMGGDASAPRRIRLDAPDGFFWDFIQVWARENQGGVDFAIDYGIDE